MPRFPQVTGSGASRALNQQRALDIQENANNQRLGLALAKLTVDAGLGSAGEARRFITEGREGEQAQQRIDKEDVTAESLRGDLAFTLSEQIASGALKPADAARIMKETEGSGFFEAALGKPVKPGTAATASTDPTEPEEPGEPGGVGGGLARVTRDALRPIASLLGAPDASAVSGADPTAAESLQNIQSDFGPATDAISRFLEQGSFGSGGIGGPGVVQPARDPGALSGTPPLPGGDTSLLNMFSLGGAGLLGDFQSALGALQPQSQGTPLGLPAVPSDAALFEGITGALEQGSFGSGGIGGPGAIPPPPPPGGIDIEMIRRLQALQAPQAPQLPLGPQR